MRISGGNSEPQKGLSLKEFKSSVIELVHNKRFMVFVGVALFFHITWHADWTLYYLGQVNYLKLNEAWLGYVIVGGAVVQFLTIGFWSRVNERLGVRFSIIIGSIGLSLFPIGIIFATSLPIEIGPLTFLIVNTLLNFAFATIILNILQCLLQVVPKKNKTLSISIYNMLILLSNATVPIAGVQVYNALGGTLQAFHKVFMIIFVLRLIAIALWSLRWWSMRDQPK
jgi:MFS family permease